MPSPWRMVGGRVHQMTRADGFTRVVGKVYYSGKSRRARLVLVASRRSDNRGDSLSVTKVVRMGFDAVALRRLLDQELDTMVARIHRREIPARKFYLSRCSTARDDVLTTICPTCTCWYCSVKEG